jgi:hypothetical protein
MNIYKINIKVTIFLCTLFVLLGACKKNETEEKWAAEEKKLADWIKENKPDLLPINGGIYFEKIGAEYEENIKPEQADHVLVDFICSFLFEDVIEEVSYKNWKERGALYPSKYREGGPELWAPDRWASMGIDNLRENEHAYVYVPSRLIPLQDFKTRKYEIHLNKVIDTDIKTYQEKLMSCYMKQYCNAVDTITVQENGKDYYVIYHVEEGTGSEVSSSSVKTTTNEYYFMQENDTKTCYINKKTTGCNDNISTHKVAISEMFINDTEKRNKPVKKGGTITAVMPYKIMYGEELKKDGNGQFIAPVSSVLLYEIKIDN